MINNNILKSIYIAILRLQPFSTVESIYFLDIVEIQKIRKELKGKSGIYGFLCKTTNKLYIGSSIYLYDRFRDHIKGNQSNIKLQNAININYRILFL